MIKNRSALLRMRGREATYLSTCLPAYSSRNPDHSAESCRGNVGKLEPAQCFDHIFEELGVQNWSRASDLSVVRIFVGTGECSSSLLYLTVLKTDFMIRSQLQLFRPLLGRELGFDVRKPLPNFLYDETLMTSAVYVVECGSDLKTLANPWRSCLGRAKLFRCLPLLTPRSCEFPGVSMCLCGAHQW